MTWKRLADETLKFQQRKLPTSSKGLGLTPKFEWVQSALKALLNPGKNKIVFQVNVDG